MKPGFLGSALIGRALNRKFDTNCISGRPNSQTNLMRVRSSPVDLFLFRFIWLFVLLLILRGSPLRAQTSLVEHGQAWRYRKGTSAPQANWKTVADAGLNATWLTGNGGIGFADNSPETSQCQTILGDMRNAYTTVAMRRSFQVTSNLDSGLHIMLTMDWDDGFIVWLDGAFLTSFSSPGTPAEPAFDAMASGLHESSRGNSSPQPARTFDLGAIGSRLSIGTHVLAIVGLNESSSSSDFVQIAELVLAVPPPNGVSGVISANTTWRAVNSPVTVVGSITVNSGITLTIEPGISVLFDSGLALTVNGRLLAEGTPENPIRFGRSPANSGRWGGLTINGGAGSPETRIAYARIEFNGTTAIEVAGGSAFLDHLTFGSTDHQYVSLDGASFVVSDCLFPSASTKFELLHGTGGIRSGGHGIFLRNFFGTPIGYSDVVDFTGGNRPGPIVHFINNVFSGSQDDVIDLDGTDAWVEGNIFMHVHRNGDTPDSAAAVSGGSDSGRTSEVTIIGNLFFDCDNACTAKQGNFFSLINNTIVHITKAGGIDGASGVVNVRDTAPSATTFARGYYLEGNIITDAQQLVRNYDPAQVTVTFNNNILPLAWAGPGTGNEVVNPLLKHLPQVSEAAFSNWQQAQVMRDWFSLQASSPALGSGPNRLDKGGVIPLGASISGEPSDPTIQTDATLVVEINRSGFAMPTAGWPNGCGYTAYKFRVDGGAWSAERSIGSPISLVGLVPGSHSVEVTGKRDSGLYQNDPLFGEDALTSISRTWTVLAPLRIDRISLSDSSTAQIEFTARPNTGYTIEYRESLSAGLWQTLVHLDPTPALHAVMFHDSIPPGQRMRFYRVTIP